jgi:hypothetical protein
MRRSSHAGFPILNKRWVKRTTTAAILALVRKTRNVAPADGVPERDILLHALRETAVFGGGERCAGVGDAGFEAVFVDFLQAERSQIDSVQWVGCVCVCTYSHQIPGVGHGGFLSDLVHEVGFDVRFAAGGGAGA